MKLFVVINNGGPFKAGTFVKEFDDGFSKAQIHNGKVVGHDELSISKASLWPFIIPYNLKGQWELYDGNAHHRAAADGTVQGAIREAIFNIATPEEIEFISDEEWETGLKRLKKERANKKREH